MACDAQQHLCVLIIFLIHLSSLISYISSLETSSSVTEILLKFKDSLQNSNALSNWKNSSIPCSKIDGNWNGVICFEGSFYGLQLENMRLNGTIDIYSLTKLEKLRTLSFMGNNFDGPLPNFKKLSSLKGIYLSNNHFQGEIPEDAFDGIPSLKKVHLAYNEFIGKIPKSLSMLPMLMELRLEGNKFEGLIPEFVSINLTSFNVSHNALDGSIPQSFGKLDSSSFTGNTNLCGKPLKECSNDFDNKSSDEQNRSSDSRRSTYNNNKSSKLSSFVVALIFMGVFLTIVSLVVGIFLLQTHLTSSTDNTMTRKTSESLDNVERGYVVSNNRNCKTYDEEGEHSRLSFLRGDEDRFGMQDLLKAYAEILGTSSFGSSYKAHLWDGRMMVVKRYRQMNSCRKEEVQKHLRRLGRLRHPNLLPLVAYYYRKEEKLLVSNFVPKQSLAFHLHGETGEGKKQFDWATRLKIVKGIAKGLSYLYSQLPNLISPHGHLKCSNVLLSDSLEPLLDDYGLLPIVNQQHAQQVMMAYKSPEYIQSGQITQKTDVWSLGILIIEILTHKFTSSNMSFYHEKGYSNLVSWVNSAIVENRIFEVLDKQLLESIQHNVNKDGEMTKLLKIGLACCENDENKRWDLSEAVERIGELRVKLDSEGEEFKSSNARECIWSR